MDELSVKNKKPKFSFFPIPQKLLFASIGAINFIILLELYPAETKIIEKDKQIKNIIKQGMSVQSLSCFIPSSF